MGANLYISRIIEYSTIYVLATALLSTIIKYPHAMVQDI